MLQLTVLYPQPADVQQFEANYIIHIALLHEKMGIPNDLKLYTTLKFLQTPAGPAPFYRLFSMPFESMEAFQGAMSSPGMQEVSADATRISTGGAPVVMIGDAG